MTSDSSSNSDRTNLVRRSAEDPSTPGDLTSRTGQDQTLRLARESEERTSATASRGGETAPLMTIGPYAIVRELGRGGMGVVYLAHDEHLKRNVALKLLPGGFAVSGEARARFRREAEAAGRLDHPGICGVFGVGESKEGEWIAMRWIPGATLGEEIAQQKKAGSGPWKNVHQAASENRTPLKDAVQCVEAVARALHAAHEAGIVHRDLKPSNIMIETGASPVILDFGLAHDLNSVEGAALTVSGDVMGTPHYMAPEQVRGASHRADRAIDIWALGVILFEVLVFRRPFDGATRDALYRSILEDEPPSLRRLSKSIPRDLDVVVATALAKDPKRRYASAAAMADDLRAILEIRPIHARPPSVLERSTKFVRRRPQIAVLLLVAFVVIPFVIYLVAGAAAEKRRAETALESLIVDAGAALDRRDLTVASKAIASASAISTDSARLTELSRRRDELALIDRLETIALDADSDQDGKLAIRTISELPQSTRRSFAAIAFLAYVHLRTGDAKTADEVLADVRPDDRDRAQELRRVLGLTDSDSTSRPSAGESRPSTPPFMSPQRPDDALGEGLSLDLFRVLSMSARGRHREALRDLTRLIELRPSAHWLAWVAAEEATAIQEYHAAYAFASRHRASVGEFGPERRARYSLHLRRAGLFDRALAEADAAWRAMPESPTTRYYLAMAQVESGLSDQGLKALESLATERPDFFEAVQACGIVYFDREDFARSLDAYRRATTIAPKRTESWLGVANALTEMQRDAEAEAAIDQALKLQPDSPFILNTAATIKRRLGKLAESRSLIEKCLALKPNYAQGVANLGSVLHSEGNVDAAVKKYEEALALDDSLASAWFNLSLITRATDPARSAECLRRVLAIEPRNDQAMLNLANYLTGVGQADEAVRLMTKACAVRPVDPMNWNNLGTALTELGRKDEAIECFEKALAVSYKFFQAHANLMLLLAEKRPIEALAHGCEVQRINPDFKEKVLGNLLSISRFAREEKIDHILVDIVEAFFITDTDEREEVISGKVEEVVSLPDGEPGTADFAIKRAAIFKLKEEIETLDLDDDTAPLDRAAKLLDEKDSSTMRSRLIEWGARVEPPTKKRP